MLRKMYLVLPDHTEQHAQPAKKNNKTSHTRHKRKKNKRRITQKLHPYDKWVAYRKKIEETDVRREALIKEIAKFLVRLLPKITPLQTFPTKNEPGVRTPLDN